MTAIILGLAAMVAIAIAGHRITTLERTYRHKERILDDQIATINRTLKETEVSLNKRIESANKLMTDLDRHNAALGLILKKISPFADAIDKTY